MMLNAILIDDERPALRVLEYHLKAYPDINVIASFSNPLEAIEKIEEMKPHTVFLDIEMPQLRGIDAASVILDKSPGTDIVFVTAYEQYAVRAFELHAMDYILKPVHEERLKKTIERLLVKQPKNECDASKKLIIRCLGRFQIGLEYQIPIKWRTEKTKELFLFLLHNEGRRFTKDELLENLWPEHDPEKAIRQLYNGIYYIRKTLEDNGINSALITIDSSYCLKLGLVSYDKMDFESRAKKYKDASPEELAEMEALYRGDYLEGEDFPWADLERQNLAGTYLRVLQRLAVLNMGKKDYQTAERLLIKAYEKDPYEETSTELLLRLYSETGEKNKAAVHFRTYAKILMEELRIKPNKKLQALHDALVY